ncbi:MAG: isoprenylcysteine carboxylmethyltransferase family protein [Anaerolinea sp.]|nr:isoprenylcysteine carboxylmethyltransferase family protein [Anaerolinea sp.]
MATNTLTSPEVQQAVKTWTRKQISFLFMLAIFLFVSAGTLEWLGGWLQMATYTIITIFNISVLTTRAPELIAERSKLQAGSKKWDVWITVFAALLMPILTWVIAGIDFRNGWTQPPLGLGWMIAGAVLFTISYLITTWAMLANQFFSATVRIQTERGHRVMTGGPYALVRHPGYVGAILFQIVTPLMLGSLWAFIPSIIAVALFVIRTYLEDKTLQAELPGYREYAQKTRYRLLPGVW